MKPFSLVELSNNLNKLPGISKKQAEKIAYYLISNKDSLAEVIADSIIDAKQSIRLCKECGHYTEDEVCDICLDKNRQLILIVVESPLDVFKFEENKAIKPYYHVLGGTLTVSNKTTMEDLNVSTLAERAKKYREVILALSPNLEGIVTSNYISKLLSESGTKVTQLAQGIPLGAAMEYVDELTLKAALENRKDFK